MLSGMNVVFNSLYKRVCLNNIFFKIGCSKLTESSSNTTSLLDEILRFCGGKRVQL